MDVETARKMVARGETNAAATTAKEPIGACPTPGCGGQIVENSRAYGCTSWKSRKNPGCGFVIWKEERGKEPITREQAVERLAAAHAAAGCPARARTGPRTGRARLIDRHGAAPRRACGRIMALRGGPRRTGPPVPHLRSRKATWML